MNEKVKQLIRAIGTSQFIRKVAKYFPNDTTKLIREKFKIIDIYPENKAHLSYVDVGAQIENLIGQELTDKKYLNWDMNPTPIKERTEQINDLDVQNAKKMANYLKTHKKWRAQPSNFIYHNNSKKGDILSVINFVSEDTIWEVKCAKSNPLLKGNILQLIAYYVALQYEGHTFKIGANEKLSDIHKINKLGIISPNKGKVFILKIKDIPQEYFKIAYQVLGLKSTS